MDVMDFDAERVRRNVAQATTEDLLDRVTAFRAGMEPEAIPIIEAELRRRGIGLPQIEAQQERHQEVLRGPEGSALRCSFCDRPAVAQAWGWHRLWGMLPVIPRLFAYCSEHRPHEQAEHG